MRSLLLVLTACVAFGSCEPDQYLENAAGTTRIAYDCENMTLAPLDTAVVREHARRILRHFQLAGDISGIRPFVAAEMSGGARALAAPVLDYICTEGVVASDVLTPRWPEPGSYVKDFAMERVEASAPFAMIDTVRGTDLAGRVYVLDVFATWCVPCIELHPHLAEVASRYGPRGVEFFTVLYNESPERASRFLDENGGPIGSTLVAKGSTFNREWGVRGIPRTFVVGADGKVAQSRFGAPSIQQLPPLLDSLLAEIDGAT